MSELPADVYEPPIVICMIENGRVTYATETMTEVSGFPPERFRGRPVSGACAPGRSCADLGPGGGLDR